MARNKSWGTAFDDRQMDDYIKVQLEIQAQILSLIEPLPYDLKQDMLTHCKHIVRIDQVERQSERDEMLRQARLDRRKKKPAMADRP